MSNEDEPESKKLTRFEKLLADEFLTGLTATEAYARTARGKKCTRQQAKSRASRILLNPHVAAYIRERQKNLSQATGIRAEQIARELSMVGFGNIKRLFNEDGTLIPVHLLPQDVAAFLAGIDVETLYDGSGKDRLAVGNIVKFKTFAKVEALEKLAKLLGFMTEKVEVINETPPIIQLVGYDDEPADDQVPAKPATD